MSSRTTPFRSAWTTVASILSPRDRARKRHRDVPRMRALAMESLEDRSLLAGLVTVTVNALGDVTVRGDNADNAITIRRNFPELRIEGFDNTLISFNGNISTFHDLIPDIVTRTLRIDMLNGNDVVELSDVEVGRDLIVNLGAGEDDLVLSEVIVGRDVTANLGTEADFFAIELSQVGRNLRIDCGAGNFDDGVTIFDSLIGGNVNAILGAADPGGFGDELGMTSSRILGDFTVTQTNHASVIFANEFTIFGNASFNTGAGEDILALGWRVQDDTRIYGTLTANTGAGNDGILIDELFTGGRVNIATGTGDDIMSIEAATVAISDFRVDLGAGNDHLEFRTGAGAFSIPFFLSSFHANGGSGTDTLVRPGNAVFLVPPVFTSFETIINRIDRSDDYEPNNVRQQVHTLLVMSLL